MKTQLSDCRGPPILREQLGLHAPLRAHQVLSWCAPYRELRLFNVPRPGEQDQAWSPRTCGIVSEVAEPHQPSHRLPSWLTGGRGGQQWERSWPRTPDSSDGGLSPSGEGRARDQLTYRLLPSAGPTAGPGGLAPGPGCLEPPSSCPAAWC